MCREQSLRNPIRVIQEVLAPVGARTRRGLIPTFGSRGIQGSSTVRRGRPFHDGNKPHDRSAVSGEDNLLAMLRAPDEIGEKAFRVAYRYVHRGNLDQS